MRRESFIDCWFLTGATASGKTAVGIELASQIDAEIISLDSMAVYRGMNLGTAKPTNTDRDRVPHHLIDIVSPDQEFSVAEYRDLAWQTVKDIWRRGREVLFVGGTPLYLMALLRGLVSGPPPDLEFRQQVASEVQQVGSRALHDRLRQVDPLSATKLHPNDVKRIIRALEVHHLTGQPISHVQTQFHDGKSADECRVFKLEWPRARLHDRIDCRVDQFFKRGFVEEVQGLLATFGSLSQTSLQAVGYREVLSCLAGECSFEQTVQSVKNRTHRFARHQETWFRRFSECYPVLMADDCDLNRIATELVALGETRQLP